jgi:Zn finger protein HypA/HybF involved in hydrogenase expression
LRKILTEEICKERIKGRLIELISYSGHSWKSKSEFKCIKCEHTWLATFSSVGKGHGCPKCSRAISGKKRLLNLDVLLKKLTGKPIKLIEYSGLVRTKSTFKCTKCDNIWKTSFNKIDQGKGCPKCNGGVVLPKEVYIDRLKNRPLEVLEYVINCRGKSTFKCTKCENVWKSKISNVLNGRNCPACAKYGFKIHKPAWFYIMHFKLLNEYYYGFGITNDIKTRTLSHRNNLTKAGASFINIIKIKYFESGKEALLLETDWKRSPYIADLKIKGFRSECFRINSITENIIKSLN